MSFNTANTLISQYLPVLLAFRLSLALLLMEWNSNKCIRYSTHSLIGIFLSSNIVLVSAQNDVLQSWHKYRFIPLVYFPLDTILLLPQFGQFSIFLELISFISSSELLRCFASYHSWTVLLIISCDSVMVSFWSHSRHLKECPQWTFLCLSFSFMFWRLSFSGMNQPTAKF